MIAKKNPKADLEKKRFAFFQIGLIIAGSTCLAAFEYSSASVDEAFVAPLEEERTTIDITEQPPVFIEPVEKKERKQINIVTEDLKVVEKKIEEGDPLVLEKGTEIITFEGDGGDDGDEFGIAVPLDPIVDVPEREPEFPGGFSALGAFINDNIDLPDYIPTYDQGTVYVQFVVNKDGSIEQVGIRQGLSPELDKAAKDVVRKMPKWVPGEQAGKPVRVRFTLPIQIALN